MSVSEREIRGRERKICTESCLTATSLSSIATEQHSRHTISCMPSGLNVHSSACQGKSISQAYAYVYLPFMRAIYIEMHSRDTLIELPVYMLV